MSPAIESLNAWSDTWWQYMLHAGWQGALVGVVLLTIVLVGRRLPAPLRHALLIVALLKFLTPPFVALPSGILSRFAINSEVPIVLPEETHLARAREIERGPLARSTVGVTQEVLAANRNIEMDTDRGLMPLPPPGADPAPRVEPALQTARVNEPSIPDTNEIHEGGSDRLVWPAYLMLVHLAGSLLCLGVVGWQAARLGRVVKSSNEVRQGELKERLLQMAHTLRIRRIPRLFTNPGVESPFSCGIVRPAIVLPTALADQLRRDEIDLVLAHELAHHRRGDLAVNWLQAIVHALWWFHPVVWITNRQLRAVREDCCDDLLLGSRLTDESVYCGTLLAVAASSQGTRLPGLALPMSCRQHGLSRRFRRLMDTSIPRAARLSRPGLLLTLVAAAVLLPGLSTGEQKVNETATGGGKQPEEKPSTASGTSALQSAANKNAGKEARRNQTRELVISVTAQGKPVEGASIFLSAHEAFRHFADGIPVYANAKSAAAGRAALQTPAEIWSEQSFYNRMLWVYQSGKALAVRQLSGDEKDVQVALEDLDPGQIRVTSPDGEPLANVTARLLFLRDYTGNFHQVPRSVTDLLQAKSDASGLVALTGIRRDQIGQIQLEHANFGRQATFFERQTRRPESIALRAAGKIVGKAAADDGAPIKGARLRLVTRPVLEQRDSQNTAGAADVTTDQEGRFVVPALMEGALRFIFLEPFDLPYRPAAPENLLVVAGESTEVTLPYRAAIIARSQARLQGSDEPVVGARIIASQGNAERYLRTDEAGKTAMYLLPAGEVRLQSHAPDGYLYVNGPHEVLVPRDKKEFDLPTFEFRRARQLTGKIVDQRGQPVERARLIAKWKDPRLSENSALEGVAQYEIAFSDAAGDFTFRRLHPDLPVTIETYVDSVTVGDTMTARSDSQEPLMLRIARPATVQLLSRVVDKEGAPMPNIHWDIWTEIRGTPNMTAYCIMDEGRTDEHGYVRSNKQFAREGLHGLRIVAAPDVILESQRMTPAKSGGNTFPDVILDRERLKDAGPETQQEARPSVARGVTQRGQIDGPEGAPIASARVIAWSNGKRLRLTANAEGRFHIPQAPTTGLFLFVEAPGYRFFGQRLTPGDAAIKVILTPADQPGEPMRTLAEPEVTSELLQKAWQAYEPFNRQYLKLSDEDGLAAINLLEAMRWVARFDPPAGLKVAEAAKNLKYPWYRDYTRMTAFETLLKRDGDRALQLIDGFTDDHYKANSYLEAAKSLTDAQRQRKLELLDQALKVTRKIPGDHLLINLARIASAYHGLGEQGKGKQTFDEALKRSGDLPASDRADFDRAFLAEQLVKFDPQAATKLLASIKFDDDYSHDRHHANVAHMLADSDPAGAERFLSKVKTQRVKDEWSPRICYGMALVDYDRARRIAEAVADPNLRAYALGVMAAPMAQKDKQKAREQLSEAYAIVTELVDTNTSPGRTIFDPLDVAVGLLPFVEMADPTLVREYFWRALSLRDNTTIGSETRALGFFGQQNRLRLADPVLATALARYDRDVARLVMHPPADQAIASGDEYPSYYFYAYAMLDPSGAIELVARLPEDNDERRKAKWQAWQEVLSSILNRGDERWSKFYDRQLSVWYVGQSDI